MLYGLNIIYVTYDEIISFIYSLNKKKKIQLNA